MANPPFVAAPEDAKTSLYVHGGSLAKKWIDQSNMVAIRTRSVGQCQGPDGLAITRQIFQAQFEERGSIVARMHSLPLVFAATALFMVTNRRISLSSFRRQSLDVALIGPRWLLANFQTFRTTYLRGFQILPAGNMSPSLQRSHFFCREAVCRSCVVVCR